MAVADLRQLDILFIEIRNGNDTRTEPCGTPLVAVSSADLVPLKNTVYDLLNCL